MYYCTAYDYTFLVCILNLSWYHIWIHVGSRCGRDRMVVGFTTTCAISANHHKSCEFEHRSWRGVLDTTLCDKVCQWLVAGRWFSPGTTVSSTNKADRHDITDILLKVALNTMNINQTWIHVLLVFSTVVNWSALWRLTQSYCWLHLESVYVTNLCYCVVVVFTHMSHDWTHVSINNWY